MSLGAPHLAWTNTLPPRWEAKRVRRLLYPGGRGIKIGPFGSALRLSDMSNEGYKVYGQEHVINGSFEIGHRYVDQAKFSELAAYEIVAGDIIVTMMGTIGQCAVVPASAKKGIMDSHLLRLRFVDGVLNSRFAVWVLNEADSTQQQMSYLTRGSIMEGLNSSIIKGLVLPVPPLAQQLAIADFLDRKTAAIDVLIRKKERLLELLQQKRQALITEAVTKGLDLTVPMKDSGVEWLGKIPTHWEVKRLKHLTSQVTVGIVVTPARYYVDEGVPVLRSLNVRPGAIVEDDLKSISAESNEFHRKSMLFAGDLVAVRTGQPGTSAVVDARFHRANCIDLIIVRQSKKLDMGFLCYFMNSSPAHSQYEEGSEGAIQQHFNIETAKNLMLGAPEVAEQKRIAEFLDKGTTKLDALVAAVRNHIEKLREYRQALISAAVTGKIGVGAEAAA